MSDMTHHPIQSDTDEKQAQDNVVRLFTDPDLMPNEKQLASHHALAAGRAALNFTTFMARTSSQIQYPELEMAARLIHRAIQRADEDKGERR